jgi:hypothetical protein
LTKLDKYCIIKLISSNIKEAKMKKLTIVVIVIFIISSFMTGIGYIEDRNPTGEVKIYSGFFVKDIAERGTYQTSFLEKVGPETLAMMYQHPGLEDIFSRAYQWYPNESEMLFREFGHLTLLTSVLERFGSKKVIPLLWNSSTGDSVWFRLDASIDRLMDKYFNDETLAEVSEPVRRVMKRLVKMDAMGESYLARFLVVEGVQTEMLSLKASFSVMEEFFFGGIEDVEEKLRVGSEITLRDFGSAAVDVITLIPIAWWVKGGKTVKVATTAERAEKASRFAKYAKSLPRVMVGKAVKYGAIGTALYLVVKQPGAVNHFLGVIAEAMGWNPTIMRLLFWLALIATVSFAVVFLAKPFIGLLRTFFILSGLPILLIVDWLFPEKEKRHGLGV